MVDFGKHLKKGRTEPVTLKLPAKLDLANLPREGASIFSWVVEVSRGQAGLIEVPDSYGRTDLPKLAKVFKTLSMACELAVAAGQVYQTDSPAAELAAEFLDPLETAAARGDARCCGAKGCGTMWDVKKTKTAEGGGQGTCPCGAAYSVEEARRRAEEILGVKKGDLPGTATMIIRGKHVAGPAPTSPPPDEEADAWF